MFGICPPMLTMTPSGFSRLTDVHHRLERDLFEVELVADVVVGADRLGVVVQHDGLVAGSDAACTAFTQHQSNSTLEPMR